MYKFTKINLREITSLPETKNVMNMACHFKLAFLLIRHIVVFSLFSLHSPLCISRFYLLFEQTINLIESFAFGPG